MKKKILIIAKYFNLGGTERRIIRIINNLNKQNYDIFLLVKSKENIHPSNLKHIQLHINIIYFNTFNPLLLYFNLKKYGKFDISICLNNFTGLFLSILLKISKKVILEGGNRSLSWPLYKKILDKIFIFRFANKIFVNSNYSAKLIRKLGCPEEKIAIVKNGIEDNFFYNNFKKPKEYDQSYLNCVSVSRLHKIKNVENFVDIFKLLENYNIRLFIIGGGDEYDNILMKIKKNKLDDKIILLGELKDFANYLIYSDIFLFVSLSESLPNSIIEAMSFSLPVIAYDVGGIKELVIDGYNGFVVKKNDVNYFADKIKFFYDNHDIMKKYGENSRSLFLENFTIDKMIRNFEERIIE